MRTGYNSTFRARLLAGSALVAVSVAVPSAVAFAQATVDIEFSTPTHALTADAGNMLPQFSAAAVSGSTTGTTGVINLTSNTATDTAYTGAYLMEDNTLASEGDGNTANGTVNLTFTPGLGTDTAAAGVFQDVTASVSATTDVDHDVDILNNGGGTASLTGTLNVTNNDVFATAKGNTASSTIALAAGVNVDGNGAQASTLTDSTYADAVDSDNAADMLVAQAQRVSGAVEVRAYNDDSNVLIDVEEVSGAMVMVSGTDITAAATGSDLTGSIASSDATATIGASAAVIGVQNLEFGAIANDVYAFNDDSDIRLAFGRSEDGSVDDNTVTVSGNRITTAATGATADQSISLVANQITGNGATATIGDTATATPADDGVQLDAAADALVASVQTMNAATAVVSDNDDNVIQIDFEDGDSEPATNNSFSITGNTMTATALGLDATNAATLEAGSTLSAPGAVASVQLVEGQVTAISDNEMEIRDVDDTDIGNSTFTLTGNAIGATAVGAQVNNDLAVANTDILSVATNAGGAAIIADPAIGTEAEAPTVTAGYSLANEQLLADADVLANDESPGAYEQRFEDDSRASTITTENNSVTAVATGAIANGAISLSFNELTGGVVGNGGVVAAAANSQRVDGGSTVTAQAYNGGTPVLVVVEERAFESTSISTSSNTVSASATANRSTGTTVTVDATNAVITGGITGTAQVDKSTGDVTASAAFASVSSQELDGSTVTAHQVNSVGTPTASNMIETETGYLTADATIVSNANTLSVAATGNTAVTGVATGTNTTAAIQATSAAANYQDVANSAINAVLGSVGTDGAATYFAAKTSSNLTSTITQGIGTYTNASGATVSYTFAQPLNDAEQQILVDAGFTNVTSTGADWANGDTITTAGLLGVTYSDPDTVANSGDEELQITTFNRAGSQGTLNTAGVIIDPNGDIARSTLQVDNNVVVGEVRGNVATNTVSATATTLTAWSTGATPSTDTDASTVVAQAADNALTSVQEVDGTSALTDTVAGTFAMEFQNNEPIEQSTITVSGNLLQSYGTSNNAANTVTLTATNSSAGAALLNEQTMTGPTGSGVVTVSDMDVATHAGMTSSDQALDNNTNQSVASANIEASTVTVDVTNATPVTGTASDGSRNNTTNVVTADTILATQQDITGTPSISATATTDVYNRDLNDATALQVITSTLSMGGNDTIAQATANNSTAIMTLGDAGTATYDASGAIDGRQVVSDDAVVSAVTSVEVGTALRTNDATNATFQSSTVSIDANTATALARGNVQSSTLTVSGANIDAGGAGDATIDDAGSSSAFFLERYQDGKGDISADSSDARFSLSAIGENSATEASDGSTLSISSNISSATAISNVGTNKLTIGSASSASLASTGALENYQDASAAGSAAATGGITVSAFLGSGSATDNTVVNGTTLNMEGNTSSASATANSATNSYTAIATNMTAGAADTDASVAIDTLANDVTAANILSNVQRSYAGHDVTATNTANSVTATVSTGAAEGTAPDNAVAINGSTVSLADNAFNAYATGNSAGNTAANSLSLGGGGTALLSANGGLVNRQLQGAAIAASGSASVRVIADGAVDGANPGTATALNASTVSVADNSVMVMARGNLANNSLSAGATSATGGDGSDGSTDGVSTTSTFGLLNHQTNTGAVNATSANARFDVALNTVATASDTAASASTVGVSGNSVMAAAYGNVATNNHALASLEGANDDATMVTASYQMVSGGAITASVTGGFAGVSAVGPVGTSTVAVRGNTFTSKAVGNFATSVVTRR